MEAVNRFADKSLDMVFLDGDHATTAVVQDILHWLPKARKLICGHDYQLKNGAWQTVADVVDGFFGTNVEVHDTIWAINLEAANDPA